MSDRFYVTPRLIDGMPGHAMVRGIPDPAKPNDPGKDSHTGEVMVEGPRDTFWAAVKDAGFRWTQESFKRFWKHAPKRALDLPD